MFITSWLRDGPYEAAATIAIANGAKSYRFFLTDEAKSRLKVSFLSSGKRLFSVNSSTDMLVQLIFLNKGVFPT